MAEEPPMPKLEFREKECLENFGIFAKRSWPSVFVRKKKVIFIGDGRSPLEKRWPALGGEFFSII